MTVRSAGILLYRRNPEAELEVWIAHMGGPFWAGKDARAWSVPKGIDLDSEDPGVAALREFAEEMGTPAPQADDLELGAFKQPAGKVITACAAASAFRPEQISSNTFRVEWPKGSGVVREYPEIDDARWCSESDARIKLVKGQLPILDALAEYLAKLDSGKQ